MRSPGNAPTASRICSALSAADPGAAAAGLGITGSGEEGLSEPTARFAGMSQDPRLETAAPVVAVAGVDPESTAASVTLPVAAVRVDSGLAHLDRTFEYAVPAELDERAQPGVRIKTRFAGQDLPGYVVSRLPEAAHEGRLSPLRTVVSPEVVLTPPILRLAEDLAAAHGGAVGDVLRLAIPPRHARAEAALAPNPPQRAPVQPPTVELAGGGAWTPYPSGAALLRRLREGDAPSAAWSALPAGGDPKRDWPAAIAEAVAHCVAGGRGALVVVPDHRDVDRLDAALVAALGPGRHARLTADQGPQARYTAWLKVLRGHVPVAIGTRAAAYAPVRELGLIVVWDDGDDLHEEPRAPYVHVRDVALARARIEAAALIMGAYGRSVAVQNLVAAGVLAQVRAGRAEVRQAAPRVLVAGSELDRERDPGAASARLPSLAWRTAREALERGPVLVQVPRRGYIPSLACQRCRARVRCPVCGGPVQLGAGDTPPVCRWCAHTLTAFECPVCGGTRLRSLVVGARRTAEELGRAFAGHPVLTSGAGQVLASVPDKSALVIATPGAEPVAEQGYAAALLLDAWALLDRPALDAGPEALRRWLGAAALVRPGGNGGSVVVVGAPLESAAPAVEALVRWDPVWLAQQELTERQTLGLPPAAVFAEVVGPRTAVTAVGERSDMPSGVVRFGPVPAPAANGRGTGGHPGGGEPAYRLLLRAEPPDAPALAAALRAARAERSARKEPESMRFRVGVTDID